MQTYRSLLADFYEEFVARFGYEPRDPFDDICQMLTGNVPFAFSRFGDGEFWAMLGRQGENCDGHAYFPDMSRRLRQILAGGPDYIVGLQPLIFMVADRDLLQRFLDGIEWVLADTFLLAIAEGRLGRLLDALEDSDVRLVGPAHLRPLSRAKGWSHIEVPSRNCWTHYEETRATTMSLLPRSDGVTLFCASMMSNVLIDDLHAWNPANTYLDVGSVFDPCVGVISRGYFKKMEPPVLLSTNTQIK